MIAFRTSITSILMLSTMIGGVVATAHNAIAALPVDTVIIGTGEVPDTTTDLRYRTLVEQFYEHMSQDRTDEAIGCISQALSLQPQNPANALLLGNLALLEQRRGNTDVALLTFDAALARDPANARIREARALLLVELKRIDEAIDDYTYLVQTYPTHGLYLYKRAMLYVDRGRYASAEVDLEKVIALDESSLKARHGLAMVYTLTARYTDAQRLYDYLIDKAPGYYPAYEDRARMYLAAGKPGFALRDINRAFELAGTRAGASLYRLRANIATAIGDKQTAKRDILKASQIQSIKQSQ